jgi:hypothetical protein
MRFEGKHKNTLVVWLLLALKEWLLALHYGLFGSRRDGLFVSAVVGGDQSAQCNLCQEFSVKCFAPPHSIL